MIRCSWSTTTTVLAKLIPVPKYSSSFVSLRELRYLVLPETQAPRPSCPFLPFEVFLFVLSSEGSWELFWECCYPLPFVFGVLLSPVDFPPHLGDRQASFHEGNCLRHRRNARDGSNVVNTFFPYSRSVPVSYTRRFYLQNSGNKFERLLMGYGIQTLVNNLTFHALQLP